MTDEVRELVANLKDAADIIDNEGYAVCTESLDEAVSLIERLAAENERKDARIAALEASYAHSYCQSRTGTLDFCAVCGLPKMDRLHSLRATAGEQQK